MQTTTRRRPPAVAKLQYPDPDKLPKHLFWLAAYFRDIAQLQAIKDLCTEMHRRHRQSDPMFHALYSVQNEHFRETIKMSLGYVVSEGMLFAFDQTTVFSAAEVAA